MWVSLGDRGSGVAGGARARLALWLCVCQIVPAAWRSAWGCGRERGGVRAGAAQGGQQGVWQGGQSAGAGGRGRDCKGAARGGCLE